MKQFSVLLIIFTCLVLNTSAQTTLGKIREAEKAYDAGRYSQALASLNEAEKLTGKVTPVILYWRIMAQKALLPEVKDPAFYTNMKKFEELEVLRENCSIYLKNYKKLDDASHYYKVYQVQLSLKVYPVAKVEFDEIMHLQNALKAD